MNAKKARDYFSDYRDDTLSEGIKQVFEQTLASDSSLMQEYQDFVRAMDALEELQTEQIEMPDGLSRLIQERMNAEAAKPVKTPFFQRWTPLTMVGATAAAVMAVWVAVNGFGGDNATANTLPVTNSGPQLISEAGDIVLSYNDSDDVLITVRRGVNGEVIDTLSSQGEAVRTPIVNAGAEPALFQISISDFDGEDIMVVLPGSSKEYAPEGQGSVIDFAKAAAVAYAQPIQIENISPDFSLSWSIKGDDPIDSLSKALGVQDVTLEQRKGYLFLSGNG